MRAIKAQLKSEHERVLEEARAHHATVVHEHRSKAEQAEQAAAAAQVQSAQESARVAAQAANTRDTDELRAREQQGSELGWG